jgi:spermidine synthase
VGQAFRPQIASFYTVDFYRDVQKQLTNGGLACQFIPAGFFTEDEFKSVVHSFIEVFPQSTLWFNKYAELILVGNTTQQPKLTPERLALLQSDTGIRSDLEYSYDLKPAQLMNQKNVFAANFIMGPETLAKLAGNALLYNDDRPILEYQAARTLYLPGRFHELIEDNLEQPDTIFARKIQLATGTDIARIRAENIHDMLSGGK